MRSGKETEEMKSIRTIEEFRALLQDAKKEHDKLGLTNVYLPILDKRLKQK
jgi:hypothetical protein